VTTAKAISAYGLRGNPFSPAPLDPAIRPEDADLVAPVDGWKKRDELNEFLAKRAAKGAPAVVIAAGGSGTGRSSLANVAVAEWAKLRDPSVKQLVVVRTTASSFDAADVLYNWVLKIRNAALHQKIPLSDGVEKKFTELAQNKPAGLETALALLLQSVVIDLEKVHAALVGVIETVNDKSFFSVALESFEYVDLLMVMTVTRSHGTEETVMSGTNILVEPGVGHVVQLGELTGSDVCELVDWRWKRFSDDIHPFDMKGIKDTFDAPRRSVAGALRLAEDLLTVKATRDTITKFWPVNQSLYLSADEIDGIVEFVDGRLPGEKK
jgi:hypothetical protein